MIKDGTKVKIKEGLHKLKVGTVGTVLGAEGETVEGTAYNVTGKHSDTGRLVTHVLIAPNEFEPLDNFSE